MNEKEFSRKVLARAAEIEAGDRKRLASGLDNVRKTPNGQTGTYKGHDVEVAMDNGQVNVWIDGRPSREAGGHLDLDTAVRRAMQVIDKTN